MENETLLTVPQVAKIFGVCPQSVYIWCKKGILKSYKINGLCKLYIKQSDVEQLFSEENLAAKA